MFKESILGLFIPKDFREFAEKVAGKYNCQVQDISFKTEHKSNILRVTIDGEDTSLDVCSKVSRDLSKWLDAHEDEIKCKSYNFEVSSPGPEKKLKTEEDLKKCINKLLYFETKTKASDGRKRYKGRVMSCENGVVHIYTKEESAEFDIVISDIAKARIEYEF